MEENILKIQELLKKHNIKLWLLVNKDNNDPIFYKYISKHLYTQSFMFIFQNKAILLISAEDKNNKDVVELINSNVKVYVYETKDKMLDMLEEIVCTNEYMDKISLSYSTLGDKDTDIILNSDLKKYTYILRNIYKKYHKKVRFSSSEKVVYDLIAENSEKKLLRIKLVAKITDEILDQTMKNIYQGMTEIDIAQKVISYMKIISKNYINDDLINVDVAWEGGPFVLVGNDLSLNGHTPPRKYYF